MMALISVFYSWIISCLDKLILRIFGHTTNNGSGAGDNDGGYYTDYKLLRAKKDVIGVGQHRTGWPWVFNNLSIYESVDGILFDDFLEQNFCYKPIPDIYREPWIAIFHHPKNIPLFGNYKENLNRVFEMEEFKESCKELKVAIALSDELAEWLREKLDCKVVSLKHPIGLECNPQWDIEKWNKDKQAYQIGFYLRNTRLIEQIPNVDDIAFNRLWSDMTWLKNYDTKVSKYWSNHGETSFDFESENYFNTRCGYRLAEDHNINFVLPSRYDEILTSGVVVVEYFECSASNVILECIASNTPIIVNRISATVQYLGEGYPLFFDHPEEIPDLFAKVAEANAYLKTMDKEDIKIDTFVQNILKEVNQIKR
jgi:hypothetical protein